MNTYTHCRGWSRSLLQRDGVEQVVRGQRVLQLELLGEVLLEPHAVADVHVRVPDVVLQALVLGKVHLRPAQRPRQQVPQRRHQVAVLHVPHRPPELHLAVLLQRTGVLHRHVLHQRPAVRHALHEQVERLQVADAAVLAHGRDEAALQLLLAAGQVHDVEAEAAQLRAGRHRGADRHEEVDDVFEEAEDARHLLLRRHLLAERRLDRRRQRRRLLEVVERRQETALPHLAREGEVLHLQLHRHLAAQGACCELQLDGRHVVPKLSLRLELVAVQQRQQVLLAVVRDQRAPHHLRRRRLADRDDARRRVRVVAAHCAHVRHQPRQLPHHVVVHARQHAAQLDGTQPRRVHLARHHRRQREGHGRLRRHHLAVHRAAAAEVDLVGAVEEGVALALEEVGQHRHRLVEHGAVPTQRGECARARRRVLDALDDVEGGRLRSVDAAQACATQRVEEGGLQLEHVGQVLDDVEARLVLAHGGEQRVRLVVRGGAVEEGLEVVDGHARTRRPHAQRRLHEDVVEVLLAHGTAQVGLDGGGADHLLHVRQRRTRVAEDLLQHGGDGVLELQRLLLGGEAGLLRLLQHGDGRLVQGVVHAQQKLCVRHLRVRLQAAVRLRKVVVHVALGQLRVQLERCFVARRHLRKRDAGKEPEAQDRAGDAVHPVEGERRHEASGGREVAGRRVATRVLLVFQVAALHHLLQKLLAAAHHRVALRRGVVLPADPGRAARVRAHPVLHRTAALADAVQVPVRTRVPRQVRPLRHRREHLRLLPVLGGPLLHGRQELPLERLRVLRQLLQVRAAQRGRQRQRNLEHQRVDRLPLVRSRLVRPAPPEALTRVCALLAPPAHGQHLRRVLLPAHHAAHREPLSHRSVALRLVHPLALRPHREQHRQLELRRHVLPRHERPRHVTLGRVAAVRQRLRQHLLAPQHPLLRRVRLRSRRRRKQRGADVGQHLRVLDAQHELLVEVHEEAQRLALQQRRHPAHAARRGHVAQHARHHARHLVQRRPHRLARLHEDACRTLALAHRLEVRRARVRQTGGRPLRLAQRQQQVVPVHALLRDGQQQRRLHVVQVLRGPRRGGRSACADVLQELEQHRVQGVRVLRSHAHLLGQAHHRRHPQPLHERV
eukprot:Rhum_TRINITY_DN15264_c11_g1::Rhum_TRINITY_DN15264_c11_g1_i1::g.149249::m.149249